MTGTEYQRSAARTLIDAPDFTVSGEEWTRVHHALVLASEVGAIAEMVKKGVFHRKGLDDDDLVRHLLNLSNSARRRQILLRGPGQADSIMLLWNLIGIVGEVGELAGEAFQRALRDKSADVERLKKEIGDVLWYAAAICSTVGLDLSDVMAGNIEKLKARYPQGWDSARSHAAGETPAEERR